MTTRDEFVAGIRRAAARRRTLPSPSPVIRDWLDIEVERMYRARTLYQTADDYPSCTRRDDAPLSPDQLAAVRVVERLLDDYPSMIVRDALSKAVALTGHPACTLETWRARAIRQGLVSRRPVRRKPVRPGSAMTFSDNQKTRRNTDRERAAVMEVDNLLRQVPRPTVDEACKQVAPRYGVAWATVKKWRKIAIKQAKEQQQEAA